MRWIDGYIFVDREREKEREKERKKERKKEREKERERERERERGRKKESEKPRNDNEVVVFVQQYFTTAVGSTLISLCPNQQRQYNSSFTYSTGTSVCDPKCR